MRYYIMFILHFGLTNCLQINDRKGKYPENIDVFYMPVCIFLMVSTIFHYNTVITMS